MDYGAAQQHWLDTMMAQQTLVALSDNPAQFREPPLVGPFRQAWNERYGHGGDYLTWKF
ncbi:hypothetical protein [Mycobacterium xenopi]|uniref:Uncharacterized protein n=2 Tax=Mycobacterium xenopi TaxID=1789 RepID=A0AAD1M1N2_MYCXE|nr:hypothetical protein [Mycobacterium xenopi]EUA34589.1 hypothetical protein I552_5372 [Mycobacterium xenopi 3993]EUA54524.1 hypothetical protein I553_1579 [Mycobacterium xenopi 4042]MDA3639828.1 hypothetical protein [Mycobacterium xenopi]MDA3658188.1 hypothetical protein [Mycobacterium xenopi]MDA3661840.1 hypothetical protein [Mycobacterium xenopi]